MGNKRSKGGVGLWYGPLMLTDDYTAKKWTHSRIGRNSVLGSFAFPFGSLWFGPWGIFLHFNIIG